MCSGSGRQLCTCSYISQSAPPPPPPPQQVSAELSSRLLAHLETLVAQCDSAYRHAPSTDTCVYTGTTGIALLHLHLATTLYADNQLKSRSHLQQAHSLLAPSLSHLPSRDVTFLCGAGGPLAIAAVLEAALGRPDQAKVRLAWAVWPPLSLPAVHTETSSASGAAVHWRQVPLLPAAQ